MVINGQAVKGAKRLANHLMKAENEKVSILEISGTAVNDNLHEALRDMETIGKLTKSQSGKVLYHANINPRKNEVLTPEQYQKASDALMEKLGMQGQPRAIVMHQKQGRQHAHLVVQLTDVDKGKLKTISNNYYKHKEVARSLEKEFELGKTTEIKKGRSFSQAEAQQAKKLGQKVTDYRLTVQACFVGARNGKEFYTQLAEKGVHLAQGRRVVVIDQNGNAQSLTRILKPLAKAQNVKERINDIGHELPDASKVQAYIRQQKSQRELDNTGNKMQSKARTFQNAQQLMQVQEDLSERLKYYKLRLHSENERNELSH